MRINGKRLRALLLALSKEPEETLNLSYLRVKTVAGGTPVEVIDEGKDHQTELGGGIKPDSY